MGCKAPGADTSDGTKGDTVWTCRKCHAVLARWVRDGNSVQMVASGAEVSGRHPVPGKRA